MDQILTGKGVGVAVMDTGIFPHMDFGTRIKGFVDIVEGRLRPYDDNGHGSHVAGIIGGSGRGSNGRFKGVATEVSFVGVKILDKDGMGTCGDAIRGINWVLENRKKYNIRVVNISISSKDATEEEENPLIIQVERMWNEGIVVVTAAGNMGPNCGTIGIPGNSRKIITVGAYDKMYGRDNTGRIREYYSGTGPCNSLIIKPEIVARGSDIVSCTNKQGRYARKSGSSMATPFVTGMIARLLQKYPDMKPVDVKIRLHDRAVKPQTQCNVHIGWGTIDESLFY